MYFSVEVKIRFNYHFLQYREYTEQRLGDGGSSKISKPVLRDFTHKGKYKAIKYL